MMTFEQFKQIVPTIWHGFDEEQNVTFTESCHGFHAGYMPKLPDTSAGDLFVYVDKKTGEASLVGNAYSMIPTIKRYDSLDDLIQDNAEIK